MSALKDLYSPTFYNRLADILAKVVPNFDQQLFIGRIYEDGFENKELKARMRHTSNVLHTFLPADYRNTARLIEQLLIHLRREKFGEDSLTFMFLPDYIEVYGLDDFEASVKVLELLTQFVSCEFAVRPFLLKYGDRMLEQMTVWSLHTHPKVRRLASEGSRPRLPWAMAIPALKKNPLPLLPLLENLKNDPSEYVRRSVANNLNDIAKDHPDVVLEIAARWKGHSKETDAIVKHGSRTLLKQGHAEILKHYGLQSENIQLSDFQILTPEVPIGDDLTFSFSVQNEAAIPQVVRLEYAVFYPRKNGTASKKVFKISERSFQPGEQVAIVRKQSFRLITTRTFYAGVHQLSIILNGEEKGRHDFLLE